MLAYFQTAPRSCRDGGASTRRWTVSDGESRHLAFEVEWNRLAARRLDAEILVATDWLDEAGFDSRPIRQLLETRTVCIRRRRRLDMDVSLLYDVREARALTLDGDQIALPWTFDGVDVAGSDSAQVRLLRKPEVTAT